MQLGVRTNVSYGVIVLMVTLVNLALQFYH